MDWLTQRHYLRLLRPKWATFYAACNQSKQSIQQGGNQRKLLEERLGGNDLGTLVQSLETFLKGNDEAGRETQDCVQQMKTFCDLSVSNTTDDAKYTIDTKIEKAFTEARTAMWHYYNHIHQKQYTARVKVNQAAAKVAAKELAKTAKAKAKESAKQNKSGTGTTLAEMRDILETDDYRGSLCLSQQHCSSSDGY